MVKVFICDVTGIKTTYTYKSDSIVSGIIKAEFEYPSGYIEALNKKEKLNGSLPKTKQMFINPKTGKEVSYYRAKALGLVE